MALSFGGSGFSAQKSIGYMSKTKSLMDKSMERIASGNKILTAGDDPGGLAVSMRLKNELSTLVGAKDRVGNAKSYVEAQSTALQSVADIVSEMQTIKINYDASSDSDERDGYESQFQDLRAQLNNLKGESINTQPLFNRGDHLQISTTADGSGSTIELTDIDLGDALTIDWPVGFGLPAGPDLTDNTDGTTLDDISEDDLAAVFDKVTGLATGVAGDQSTLGFASDYLSNMSTNLEAAHGRIMDVDIAEESANYAKLTMQYEAAAAAVAQANVAMGAVLDLLLTSVDRD
jgi:flagellin